MNIIQVVQSILKLYSNSNVNIALFCLAKPLSDNFSNAQRRDDGATVKSSNLINEQSKYASNFYSNYAVMNSFTEIISF